MLPPRPLESWRRPISVVRTWTATGIAPPHDCDDTNPGCRLDCTDADGDGFCPPHDCDDSNPHWVDTDSDGVPDACDNCPVDFNPDQLESEGFEPDLVITDRVVSPRSVAGADVDGDGDLDVLSASLLDEKVAWYEKLDGDEIFGSQNVIATDGQAKLICSADVNGDGSVDAIVALQFPTSSTEVINWYRISGGVSGTAVAEETHDILSMSAHDLDGDGDLDILVAVGAPGDGSVGWYENLAGSGLFSLRRPIGAGVRRAVAGDVDGDGDLDVVAAGRFGVRWFDNVDGTGGFSARSSLSSVEAGEPLIADLDGDGDADVAVVHTEQDEPYVVWDRLAWYENVDGAGTFGTRSDIDDLDLNGWADYKLDSEDVDRDGDNDLFCGASFGMSSGIAWYENSNNGAVSNAGTSLPSIPRTSSSSMWTVTGMPTCCPPPTY